MDPGRGTKKVLGFSHLSPLGVRRESRCVGQGPELGTGTGGLANSPDPLGGDQ